jgi:hypothetical protein
MPHVDGVLVMIHEYSGLGSPSETRVKGGHRIVGTDTELVEKLGGKDLCSCGSGRRFKRCCHRPAATTTAGATTTFASGSPEARRLSMGGPRCAAG